MENISKKILFLFLLAMIVGLSACGKVSEVVPYEGSGYPHTYPRR